MTGSRRRAGASQGMFWAKEAGTSAYRKVHICCYLVSTVSWCLAVCNGGVGSGGSAD